MPMFCELLEKGTEAYHDALDYISDQVCAFGGSGWIHGSIVDIDFYNHICLRPNGTIVAYYSPEYGTRTEYSSLEQLLVDHAPNLLSNYQALISSKKALVLAAPSSPSDAYHTEDNSIYAFSRIMEKINYLLWDNVLRVWDEDLLNALKSGQSNLKSFSLDEIEP
jgi:hypothetical protein